MFRKVEVPVLGLIENMSYFACPHCGERSEIFSHGGGKAAAEKFGVPFLGEVPLDIRIREGGDQGEPVVAQKTDSPVKEAFRQIAARLAEQINAANAEDEKGKTILGKVFKFS
jgi:ATP-binding protein involved in chromosome partitioning